MSIAKKGSSKSRKPPLVDDLFDRQIPWPVNPRGYVVTEKEIEQFIGNQIINKAQITAKRFMVVADAAKAVGKGENVDLNWQLIHHTASLDKSEDYQRIMKAMIEAIEKGREGIIAAYITTKYLLEYGFEYTASCNREKLYEDRLKRLSRAAKNSK
jgi:hypothetical protein